MADHTQPVCNDAVSRFLLDNTVEGTEREILIQCKAFLGEGLITDAQYSIVADKMLAF